MWDRKRRSTMPSRCASTVMADNNQHTPKLPWRRSSACGLPWNTCQPEDRSPLSSAISWSHRHGPTAHEEWGGKRSSHRTCTGNYALGPHFAPCQTRRRTPGRHQIGVTIVSTRPDRTLTPHSGPRERVDGAKSVSTNGSPVRDDQSQMRSYTSFAATSSDRLVGTGSTRASGAAASLPDRDGGPPAATDAVFMGNRGGAV